MRLTVAICTWNRAALLDQTLQAMRSLVTPAGVEWDVLVVDNRCTDDTAAVVDRHTADLNVRRIVESRQGKSHALNTAVQEMDADWFVWTDDDVLVEPDWLQGYAEAIRDLPDATFFGGRVEALFEVTPPAWVTAGWHRLRNGYAVREFGDERFLIERPNEAPYGCNWAIRSDVQRQYRYDPKLGRSGAGLMVGEETELVQRLLGDGHRGYYVPDARLRHFIPRQRLTRRHVRRAYFGLGRTMRLLNSFQQVPRRKVLQRALRREWAYQWRRCLLPPEQWVEDMLMASMLWGALSLPEQAETQAAASESSLWNVFLFDKRARTVN